MKITSDWHIHSRNSCDSACLEMADLIASAEQLGISDFGVTDHIHTPFNLPDMVASREEYHSCAPDARFHFGIEVSVVSQWELDELREGEYENPVYGLRQGGPPGAPPAIGISGEQLNELGVEYVVGGTHWPLYVEPERDAVIRDYHRQNMFLATHPLVDIVAHPWWWMGHWQDSDGRYTTDPWLDDFGKIPPSMHEEFAAAAMRNGKAIEINISAMLINPAYPAEFPAQYMEYVAGLKDAGATLSLGSDCHSRHYGIDFEKAARMLEAVGIRDDELWRLPPRG